MGEPQINQKHGNVLKKNNTAATRKENHEKTLPAKNSLLAFENAEI